MSVEIVVQYLTDTRHIAAETSSQCARFIDIWRVVVVLFHVLWHWLAASIWLRSDGEIALTNPSPRIRSPQPNMLPAISQERCKAFHSLCDMTNIEFLEIEAQGLRFAWTYQYSS